MLELSVNMFHPLAGTISDQHLFVDFLIAKLQCELQEYRESTVQISFKGCDTFMRSSDLKHWHIESICVCSDAPKYILR